MNPQLIAFIVAEVAKNAPLLAIDIIEALNKGGTPAEFDALRARWSKPMDQAYLEAQQRLAGQTPAPGVIQPLSTPP